MIRQASYVLFALVGVAATTHGQIVTTTFEDQGLVGGGYLDNAGPGGHFTSGGNNFNNSYDNTFAVWSGWAMSAATDSTTPGFGNQYSSITGSGAGGSTSYGVAMTFAFPTDDPFHPADSLVDLAAGTSPVSVDVTNTTYAYYAMALGYFQAHQFGPGDFLLLDVRGYNGPGATGSLVGEVDFYLASFLTDNPYIVDAWQTLDLSSLAGAKSLRFGLRSSDNDATYGVNTPAYLAIDNLRLRIVPEPGTLTLFLVALVCLFARHVRRRHGFAPRL